MHINVVIKLTAQLFCSIHMASLCVNVLPTFQNISGVTAKNCLLFSSSSIQGLWKKFHKLRF